MKPLIEFNKFDLFDQKITVCINRLKKIAYWLVWIKHHTENSTEIDLKQILKMKKENNNNLICWLALFYHINK